MNFKSRSRQNHGELHDLDTSLRSMIPDTRPLPDVEELVWREIERRQVEGMARNQAATRVKPAWRIAAATFVAVLVIGSLTFVKMFWSPAVPRRDTIARSGTSSSRRDLHFASRQTSRKATSRSPKDINQLTTAMRHSSTHRASASRKILARAFATRKHPVGSRAETRLAKATTGKTQQQVARLPAEVTWASWGAWYEQQGDYERAAAAYRNAEALAARKVSPSGPAVSTYQYTYQAGRTAECAGDVSAAIDYYSKMLSGATTAQTGNDTKDSDDTHDAGSGEKPDKGAQIWRPLDISA